MAHILLVDDDPSLARVLAYFLRSSGHTPIIAPDARSALQALDAHPDLILLDIGLPDMRGDRLLTELRSRPESAEIPVVVLSGESEAAALVARTGADGVATVLRKPVPGADVCRVVDAVLATLPTRMVAEGMPTARRRASLIHRIILEGSTPLVCQVCRLLEIERRGWGSNRAHTATWPEIARAAREECLVDDEEAQLLLGAYATEPNPPRRSPALDI